VTTHAGQQGRRILLVDDDEAVSAPVARYLRNQGWVVDVAGEPEEAQALVVHRRYDLAILDLRLTRVGNAEGLDVARELRRRNEFTSVILLSAYVSPDVEDEAARLGVDALLRKPLPLHDVARVALALMGSAA
jgi:DNA-binding response OmpR family regulator